MSLSLANIQAYLAAQEAAKQTAETATNTPPQPTTTSLPSLNLAEQNTATTTGTNTPSGGGITLPNIGSGPGEITPQAHTPVRRIEPYDEDFDFDKYTPEQRKAIVNRLRDRYNYVRPAQGTPGYGGIFGGTGQGLGFRNDNPMDYSRPGAGLWAAGIDPADPAAFMWGWGFQKDPNYGYALSKFGMPNTGGGKYADLLALNDLYYRDLAMRMDKSNSFFDSFFGNLFVSIITGFATAGVGALFGKLGATIFGAVLGGIKSDWDPLSIILGGLGGYGWGNILDATGISGVLRDILPDWAEFVIPESTEMVFGIDKFGVPIVKDVFDYTLDDILLDAGELAAKESLDIFRNEFRLRQDPTEDFFAGMGQMPASDQTTQEPLSPSSVLGGLSDTTKDVTISPIEGTTPVQEPSPIENIDTTSGINQVTINPILDTQLTTATNPLAPTDPFAVGYARGGKVSSSKRALMQLLGQRPSSRKMQDMADDEFIEYANRILPMSYAGA